MERRRLGRTDIVVSVLGFGGSEIGYERAERRTVARLLGGALDAGLNVDRHGRVLRGQRGADRRGGRRAPARRFYLFTKCGHPRRLGPRRLAAEASLLASIERSLQRLRTDRLDLIQLHSCSAAELRKGDVIAALEQARERGWTRYIGYSGDGEAARYAVECGRFDTLQTSVSIADQEAIELTLPLAREAGDGRDRQATDRERGMALCAQAPRSPTTRRTGRGFVGSTTRSCATRRTPRWAQRCASRWAVPGVHTAIVGTKQPERWQENAALLAAGALPPTELERIRSRWREVADHTWDGQV